MTERDQRIIDKMKKDQGFNTLQAMILLVLADEPAAQPGAGGVQDEEILFLLESRFTSEELIMAQKESDAQASDN